MALFSSRLCPICEAQTFLRGSVPSRPWSFTTVRFASKQRQKSQSAKPGRMELSPNVARPKASSAKQQTGARPSKIAGAFASMNQTRAGGRVLAEVERKRSMQERRKSRTSFREDGSKKQPNKQREMKALKMHRALATVPYAHRNLIKERLESVGAFSELGLSEGIQKGLNEALAGLTDIKPTPIQRLAISALLGETDAKARKVTRSSTQPRGMQQYLLAAETGSGKTLAYLIPTVEATKREEVQEKEEEAARQQAQAASKPRAPLELEPPPLSSEEGMNAGRPRAIVLLPTAELVEQVGAIFKLFAHTVKQRVAIISGNYTATVIRNRLFGPSGVDIVISTPHLLSSIATTTPHILSRVTHLVIDEADSLFDRSFAPITSAIVDRAAPSLKALTLCSATIPRNLDTYLRTRFPEMQRLTTPNLHAIPRRVVLSVVDIDASPYNSNRDLACADTVWNIGRSTAADDEAFGNTRRIIVFVNEREKSVQLASYLQSKGVDAAALNRDTADTRTGDVLAAFTSSDRTVRDASGEPAARVKASGDNRVLKGTKVLVVTDIASRGIDTLAVRHVVLYDVPHTSIDFIHRLGRTGRMGRRGRGVVLAGKHDRKDVIREVREAMFRGSSLI